MPSARDEIYYALMYVDYKSRNTLSSGIFRTPQFLAPSKLGVSESLLLYRHLHLPICRISCLTHLHCQDALA